MYEYIRARRYITMKPKLMMLLGITVMMLLTVSMISAQNRPNSPNMPGGNQNHVRHNGFEGLRGNMNITGEIYVEDAIYITLTAQPTEEAIERIQENRRGEDVTVEDLTNEISIAITELVEFIDNNNDGYDENDTVISSFALNDNTLDDPQMVEGENSTEYTINAVDGSFTLLLYLNEGDGTLHTWKWSVEINYDFEQVDTNLAIIQQVTSNRRPLTRDYMNTREDVGPRIMDRELRDGHAIVPMFFKWDNTAIVDGLIKNVTASRALIGDNFVIALSIPQGDSIFYDPEIGVEIATIDGAQSFIDQVTLLGFVDTISSPTVIGIILASVLLLAVVGVAKYR